MSICVVHTVKEKLSLLWCFVRISYMSRSSLSLQMRASGWLRWMFQMIDSLDSSFITLKNYLVFLQNYNKWYIQVVSKKVLSDLLDWVVLRNQVWGKIRGTSTEDSNNWHKKSIQKDLFFGTPCIIGDYNDNNLLLPWQLQSHLLAKVWKQTWSLCAFGQEILASLGKISYIRLWMVSFWGDIFTKWKVVDAHAVIIYLPSQARE